MDKALSSNSSEPPVTAHTNLESESPKHTSVIYVHGVGSQRRYEETSRLIDSMDRYLLRPLGQHSGVGSIERIEPLTEPLRSEKADTISYIRTIFKPRDEANDREVRFYELYWAPILAEEKSAWSIIKWMLRQPLRPIITLLTPWRQRQRLRRSSLISLMERRMSDKQEYMSQDYVDLLDCYDAFEEGDALKRFKKGNFNEFRAFIEYRLKNTPNRADSCKKLAEKWLCDYLRVEVINGVALWTIALGLVLSVLAVPFSIQALAQHYGLYQFGNWPNAVSAGLALAGFVGVGKLLSDYMGDVQVWATYEETDLKFLARNKILQEGLEVLTHVLADSDCDRVAIVSHSLGTTIANETLLRLTRRCRAGKELNESVMEEPLPLKKIEHFITMGSPIDKIEYFFESYVSASHHYMRVVEKLRGDIGTEPFTWAGKAHVHWINFWDRGDQISGPLQSPANAKVIDNRVDNQSVASFVFPSTVMSHSGYFTNRTVISTIFAAIYLRKHSFAAPEVQEVLLGGDTATDKRYWFFLAAGSIPWLALLGLLLSKSSLCHFAIWPSMIAYLEFAILFILAARSAEKGQRDPI